MQPTTIAALAFVLSLGAIAYAYATREIDFETADPETLDRVAIAACKDEIAPTLRDRGAAEILSQTATAGPQGARSVSIIMRIAKPDIGLQDVIYACAVRGKTVLTFTQHPAQP